MSRLRISSGPSAVRACHRIAQRQRGGGIDHDQVGLLPASTEPIRSSSPAPAHRPASQASQSAGGRGGVSARPASAARSGCRRRRASRRTSRHPGRRRRPNRAHAQAGLQVAAQRHRAAGQEQVRRRAVGDRRPALRQAPHLAVREVDRVRQDRPRSQAAGAVVDIGVVDGVGEEPGTSAISPRPPTGGSASRHRSRAQAGGLGQHLRRAADGERGEKAYARRPSSRPCQARTAPSTGEG